MVFKLFLERSVNPSNFSLNDLVDIRVFIVDLSNFAPVDRSVYISLSSSFVVLISYLFVKVFGCLRCLDTLRRVDALGPTELVSLSLIGRGLLINCSTCTKEALHLGRLLLVNQFH